MTGFERNSDVVEMASYAPLFAREGHHQWSPDLIWFNGTESWVTPNYYVQQLFSLNRPDFELPVEVTGGDLFYACAGTRGDETIVKLVNAADTPREVAVNKTGLATVTMLSAEKNAMNRHGDEKIRPITSRCKFDGTIVVPPLSLTVIAVK